MCWLEISKAKWQTLVLTSNTHHIWMFSCLQSSKDLKAQKLCNKFLGLIIVHVIKITSTNFDGCHKVTYKYVLHLGKLDKNMH